MTEARTATDLRDKFEEYHRTRDEAVREELVGAYIGLAKAMARRFSHRGEALDDLVQIAYVGLLSAIDRFDPERQVEFTTFAIPTIKGELKRYFRDSGWALHVPRRVKQLHVALNETIEMLTQRLGRSPTVAEMAKEMDVTEEEILEVMEAGWSYRAASIDDNRGDSSRDAGSAATLGAVDARLSVLEDRLTVSPLLRALPARERIILQLRFFEGLTQSQIAGQLGISQVHVSRLLTRSLERLRREADARG
ncbi:MAG: SigB/SigF/SigG family RNA polymerase sigma factor [Actinomycetota bacterium]